MSRDNQEKPDKIQAFDTLFTTNHIQMHKILLPYFEPAMQKQMAVYIKFMEFAYTVSYFKQHPYASMPVEKTNDTEQICREIFPYCSASEKSNIEKITEMFSTMKNVKEMMDAVNMMKDMFPDASFGDGTDFPADAMQMFQMFNNFK